MIQENQKGRSHTPFSVSPPGYSLTEEPGKWAWDNPPEHATVGEFVSSILDNLEEENVREDLLNLMVAGISIEEIVSIIALQAFASGKCTVDVAELSKGPLALFLMSEAKTAKIPVRVYQGTKSGAPPKPASIPETTLKSIMVDRNPELYNLLLTSSYDPEKETEVKQKPQNFMGDHT